MQSRSTMISSPTTARSVRISCSLLFSIRTNRAYGSTEELMCTMMLVSSCSSPLLRRPSKLFLSTSTEALNSFLTKQRRRQAAQNTLMQTMTKIPDCLLPPRHEHEPAYREPGHRQDPSHVHGLAEQQPANG